MRRLILICLCASLTVTVAHEAFAWGAVSGPNGGEAYRGPAGATYAKGPQGGTAYRSPSYYGSYHGTTAYHPGAAYATGVAVGAAAATAYKPPPYYPPPCGYYPYPACP